jgi:hypothetical protein
MRRLLLILLAASLFMGAEKCSKCDEARARAEAVCRLQPGTETCAEARAEADAVCKPKPTPVPTPVPTPIPTPVPTPTTCTFPQGVPQFDFRIVPNPREFSAIVDATIRENTFCSGETDCTWGPEDPQVYQDILIAALQRKGLCAGRHNPGNDQISVARTCAAGVVWENYQPVNYGGVQHKARFASANVKDGWVVPRSCQSEVPPPTPPPTSPPTPTPEPTPAPTPTPGACPLMTFLKMDRKDLPGILFPVIDVTPQGPDKARCLTIGKDQDKCPLGPEGPNPEDNAERIRCEIFYGPYAFSLNGHPCEEAGAGCFHHSPNPLNIKVSGHGTLRVEAKGNGVSNQMTIP